MDAAGLSPDTRHAGGVGCGLADAARGPGGPARAAGADGATARHLSRIGAARLGLRYSDCCTVERVVSFELWLVSLVAAVGLSFAPGPNGLLALTHGARFGLQRTLFTVLGGA